MSFSRNLARFVPKFLGTRFGFQSKCFFLAGVSGVGKTFVLSASQSYTLRVFELDSLLPDLHRQLCVNPLSGDPYSYSDWLSFLDNAERQKQFRIRLCEILRTQGLAFWQNSIFVSNHFLLEPIEENLLAVLEAIGLVAPIKLLLEASPEEVYRRRQRRANPWYVKRSLPDVIREVEEMRNALVPRGYLVLGSDRVVQRLSEPLSEPPVPLRSACN